MRYFFLLTILNSATIVYLLRKLKNINFSNDDNDYIPTLIQDIKDYKYV